MAAHISRDQDHGRTRMVREFIAEFRGLTGSAKQKTVLEEIDASRTSLAEFFGNGDHVNKRAIAALLVSMKQHTRPVKPRDLGVIGREHLLVRFIASGVEEKTFRYRCDAVEEDGIPYVVETAFGFCPRGNDERRIIRGVNWSVAVNDPFRSFGAYGESLSSILTDQRAGPAEPIVIVVHLASPRIDYTDRGKSAISIPGSAS
jgi:hypothetical protein